jgi:hypothetical protein
MAARERMFSVAKDKRKKKAEGAKGPKLPKRIAGVKVPKELREPGGKLLAAVQNPLVIDLAAAALAAAAARMRDTADQARGPGAGPRRPDDLGAILTATALEGVRRLGEATRNPRRGPGDGNGNS